jgi:TolB protein
MNVDGSNQVRLTHNESQDGHPDWSPDTNYIVFESERDGNFEIYVMNPDGSDPRNLTNNSLDDYLPSWSPRLTGTAPDAFPTLTVPASMTPRT